MTKKVNFSLIYGVIFILSCGVLFNTYLFIQADKQLHALKSERESLSNDYDLLIRIVKDQDVKIYNLTERVRLIEKRLLTKTCLEEREGDG